MGKLLGIDYGNQWFGLALSDPTQTIARPLDVVRGQEDLWKRLENLIAEEDIESLVLGLPRNMDGSLGPKAREALAFKEVLETRSGLAVEMWDERLTTVQAERALRAGGMSRTGRRERVDKVAAQILLQNFLDNRARLESADDGDRTT